MPLSTLAVAALEDALNRYLDLDPDTQAQLATLHGRVIGLEVLGLGLTLYFAPAPHRLQLLSSFEGTPTCRLRGAPLALARLGRGSGAQGLFGGDVTIEGDTETAHRFGEILAALDVDWEEQLSRLTGDVAAHQIGQFARSGAAWARNSHRSLEQDLGEYLKEEGRLLPTRFEVDAFMEAVDRTRDDVERLEARISRLLQNRGRTKGAR